MKQEILHIMCNIFNCIYMYIFIQDFNNCIGCLFNNCIVYFINILNSCIKKTIKVIYWAVKKDNSNWWKRDGDYGCFHHYSSYTSICILVVIFIGGGNQSTQRKALTVTCCHRQTSINLYLFWIQLTICRNKTDKFIYK